MDPIVFFPQKSEGLSSHLLDLNHMSVQFNDPWNFDTTLKTKKTPTPGMTRVLNLLGYFSSTHQPLATKRFILHLDTKTHPKTLNNYTPPKLTSTLRPSHPLQKINKNMELRLGRSQSTRPFWVKFGLFSGSVTQLCFRI